MAGIAHRGRKTRDNLLFNPKQIYLELTPVALLQLCAEMHREKTELAVRGDKRMWTFGEREREKKDSVRLSSLVPPTPLHTPFGQG